MIMTEAMAQVHRSPAQLCHWPTNVTINKPHYDIYDETKTNWTTQCIRNKQVINIKRKFRFVGCISFCGSDQFIAKFVFEDNPTAHYLFTKHIAKHFEKFNYLL